MPKKSHILFGNLLLSDYYDENIYCHDINTAYACVHNTVWACRNKSNMYTVTE